MIQPLLEIKDLRAYYRTTSGLVRAVDGVDLVIGKNEIFAIAGESGCGKSTLAKAALRMLKPPAYIESGKILFNGTDLLALDKEGLRMIRGNHISYIPQSSMNALNPVTRIEAQIMDVIREHVDWSKDKAKDRVAQLLKMVALPDRCIRMYANELSGGMRQRAIIAIAMALTPDLIIADEPTTALDVVIQRAVLKVIREAKEKFGASFIFISHDMAVHAEIADRMAIMYAGKVGEVGNINDVFKDPLHPYTQVLISAVPTIEERRQLKSLAGRPPDLINPPLGCRFHLRCPRVIEKCSQKEPTLEELSPGRLVACHLYGE